jgi:predicted  nucleic acid-binding Zn-ribbon protein
MQDFVLNLLSLFFGGAITWLFARKKQDADTTRVNLENINLAVAIWRDTAKELSTKVDVLTEKCEKLTTEVEMLRKENVTLKKKLDKTIETIDQNNK